MTRFRVSLGLLLVTCSQLSMAVSTRADVSSAPFRKDARGQPGGLMARAATSASHFGALKAADGLVFDRLRGQGFSGAVSVYKDGKLLLQRASGNADVGRAFATTTKVDVASLAKPITAMAIFQLIEQGKVHLSDSLEKWFPDVPADKRGVTVRQMLNHTSGLVDFPAGMTDYTRITQREMQKRIFAEPLDFPPGSKNRYSNSGFNLLGMLVEKASGVSLFDYLERHAFRPAGVRASYDPEHFAESEVAGSPNNASEPASLRQMAAFKNGPFWGLWGAGGVFMSAPDTAKLFQAFQRGSIVSKASAALMITDTVPAGSYASEGLGWTIIHTGRGDDFVSYTGGSAHSNSAIRFYPGGNVLIAVVANSESPGSVRMARELAEPLVGADFAPIRIPPETPSIDTAGAADVKAIQLLMAAVVGNPADRLAYIRANFSPQYRETAGEEALVDKIGNLASIGTPKVISIFRRGNDSVLMFETQESEYPRLYELVLHRHEEIGAVEKYEIKRIAPS